MLPKAVTQYLQANRQKHLDKLFELLRIESVSNLSDGSCAAAADWLKDYLTGIGMNCRVVSTAGHPLVMGSIHRSDDAPTLLIYGHYDVQPPDPLDQWLSPPFEPEVRDGWIFARGADDDKGQLFANVMAIEAWQAAGGPPINVKVLFEGEEELASPSLEAMIGDLTDDLAADALLISDSAFYSESEPSITYALRGIVFVELTLTGPNCDLHSGVYGGVVANPVNALARMIAKMQDDDGKITLPGFYDDVLDISDLEREAWAKLDFDEQAYAARIGLDAVAGGERDDFSPLERNWARPTLDCNGIVGGFIEQGAKTIIPSRASAKISMRLVANQDPEKISDGLRQFVRENTPEGIKAEINFLKNSRPVLLPKDSPAMTDARDALTEAFAADTTLICCGASVPITEVFQRILGLDAVMMGYGLPEDALHSPNEKFKLSQFYGGSVATAAFMQNLAKSTS